MVRLDASHIRYMTREDFRVLTAVEMGMKNHDVVPTELIGRIAGLRSGNGLSIIGQLAKYGLIKHVNHHYDGYRLTHQGYDYLALKAFIAKGLIKGVGPKIGVGKESDVYEVINNEDEVLILKVHRLGLTSFRTVREKRDYLQHRKNASFLYLARLAAVREFAYLKALYDEGYPTAIPYEINRHCILMSKIKGEPMCNISKLKNPERVYNTLMNLIVRFAEDGLIHGDFNEYNLFIDKKERITVIDFPQMISTSHPQAKEYFDRDTASIRRLFIRKLGYQFHDVPEFVVDIAKTGNLDESLKASSGAYQSGFTNKENEDFERIMADNLAIEQENNDDDDEEDYEEDEDCEEDGYEDEDDMNTLVMYDFSDDEDDEDEESEEEEVKKVQNVKSNKSKYELDSDEDDDEDDENNTAPVWMSGKLTQNENEDEDDDEDNDDLETLFNQFNLDTNQPEEEPITNEFGQVLVKKKKKTGLAKSQIRQKLNNAKKANQSKKHMKANMTKIKDRKMKAAIREIRNCM